MTIFPRKTFQLHYTSKFLPCTSVAIITFTFTLNFQFNVNFGAIFVDNPYFTLKSADLPFTAPLCAIYHWKGNFLRCLEPFLVHLLGSNCVHDSEIKEKKWSTIKNAGNQ